jgi:hypothetical protein
LRDTLADETLRLACATEVLVYIAFDTLREKIYPFTAERAPWNAESFAAAVESQDEDAAAALFNGAFAQGLHFADVEPALAAAAGVLQRFRPFADLPDACAPADRAIGNRGGKAAAAGMAAVADLRHARDLLPTFAAGADALVARPASVRPGGRRPVPMHSKGNRCATC